MEHSIVIYSAINYSIASHIPQHANRILDVGCGSGELGRHVKEKIACEYWGITYLQDEQNLASRWLDLVLLEDLDRYDTCNLGKFDCIICSHVLEHLHNPKRLLEQLTSNLTPGGILIVALPNVLYWSQRIEFIRGNFKYTNGGLMDSTHLHFFEWQTSRRLIEESGFEVVLHYAEGHFPLSVFRIISPSISRWLDTKATNLRPGLFGAQFVTIAKL